ncbi:MAG: Stp1/IreP family PP2C-type Ser/Thr phosphatase [Actinobacteria bacterium]|nr:Stp1/IreP family PP2C-type Ser/Thr phosphatase [Actinomycetota bacterium]
MSALQYAGLSHTGRRRRRNEDAYVLQPPLFAVADGMGGPRAGEIASRLAAEALQSASGDGFGESRVVSLIQTANRRIYQRSSEDAEVSGMGTTITVALVEDGTVALGHVGDSRAYLIREGRLEQLTEDHSLVGELYRSGKLSRAEADSHPQRSVITRALGTDPDVDVDTFTIESRPGDVFLLCSDGLTTMVRDEDLLEIVERQGNDLEQAARTLIDTANQAGGEDNITVVFFRLTAPDEASSDREEAIPSPPEGADEDTLTELDRVPTLEPARSAAPGPLASPPAEPASSPHASRLLAAVGVAVVVAVAIVCGLPGALLAGPPARTPFWTGILAAMVHGLGGACVGLGVTLAFQGCFRVPGGDRAQAPQRAGSP